MTTATIPKRKLIEVALPLEAINKESAREKSIRHGHPSTFHLWWSRKPLATARAVLFASLVDDPSSHRDKFPTEIAQDEERQRLFRLIEDLVKWENSNNKNVLGAAHSEIMASTGGNPPPVLDPFAGGGSIPMEAQRLGLEAHASDLNPVAVLINKALIEIPSKYAGQPPVNPYYHTKTFKSDEWTGAKGLAEDVHYYGKWMHDEAEKRIGCLYPKVGLPDGSEATVIAWLWARTVKCPNPACGADMPLTSKWWLSTKKGKETWVEPRVDSTVKPPKISFYVKSGKPTEEEIRRISAGSAFVNAQSKKVKATFTCIACGVSGVKGEYIDSVANLRGFGQMPLAVVYEAYRGRGYLTVQESDVNQVNPLIDEYFRDPEFLSKLPSQPARGTFASNAQGRIYGFKTFSDYFTRRQLIALSTFSDLVEEVRDKIMQDLTEFMRSAEGIPKSTHDVDFEYANAIAIYLSLVVNKLADLCNSLNRWEPVAQCPRQLFARQGISMIWEYAEGNPLSSSSGSWETLFKNLMRSFESPLFDYKRLKGGEAVSGDAALSLNGVDQVIYSTDPPYYDNIGYADLSDFFYVWSRRSLSKIMPTTFSTLLVPKERELVATPHRFEGNKDRAQKFFEEGLGNAFAQMRLKAHADFPLTVFYAFKQTETDDLNGDGTELAVASTGWETMLEGLLKAGFQITGTWPMRTEMLSRMVGQGTNALASSIVLVCRPRSDTAPIATRREFLMGLRRELPQALRELQQGSIAPVDLAQASIGPGMAVFSRYQKVLESDGRPMPVRAALSIINQMLDEVLAEQEGEFDADTRWALAWFEQFGVNEGSYGDAETLSKAKNTSVAGMVEAGIVRARSGKVKLLWRTELPNEWSPANDSDVPVWEATQHLVKRLEEGGEVKAAALLAALGSTAEIARDLAYRLYSLCERKKWAQEALAYNTLVSVWPELTKLAANLPQETTVTQPSAFGDD